MAPSALTQKYVTFKEIHGQPGLWQEVLAKVSEDRARLDSFFATLPGQDSLEVLFTGAGSSAFVGEAVAALFENKTGLRCRPVATTDIVTHPRQCIPANRPVLLVSFARSGNSPESIAAVKLANQVSSQVFHLIITCNKDGALAKLKGLPRSHVVLLPEEANDKGLAMIGSVTGMILATLLIADRADPAKCKSNVDQVARAGQALLESTLPAVKAWSELPFSRIVCLGSGPLLGVAREAHLKVQELSDGKVIGKFDSFLGFRHGPKAVVNDATFLLHFASRDAYVAQYESDLITSVTKEQNPLRSAVLAPGPTMLPGVESLSLDPQGSVADEAYLLPLYLLPAQLLGAYKSLQLGLNPDSPSPRGAIHRVVQGVNIYPFPH